MKPRAPNKIEREQLAELFNDYINSPEETNDICISVFDHYITDSPGYHGKVISIIWPGGPELHTTIIYNNGIPEILNDI